MKKKVLALLLVAVMMLMGVACAQQGNGTSDEGTVEKEDITFVIVPKVVHAWFDLVNDGAVLQAKLLSKQIDAKVIVDYRAPTTADVAEQNRVLEQAAATNPAGIALDPVDYEGSKAVIEEIQARGIPVILFDAPAPEGSGLTSVGNDFSEQAIIASEALAKELNYEGKVAVMQGFPSAPNHAERYEAHLKTLAQYPNIEVIDGGIDNDSVEEAQTQAAAVLAANPDLDGYLNCDASGTGVAAAIEEAGREDEIAFYSMDNLIEILEYVKSGTITATSSTMPQMQGSMSILMLWQAHLGVDIPQTVDTGIAYIDSSNVDEWIEIVK
ncbi:MAG: sugar ABC transporter substrate-binding protein [Fastidiosipila sp.]|nr:sugar ABC transporter substrate-binding protein [Fastidiosipila sp.]